MFSYPLPPPPLPACKTLTNLCLLLCLSRILNISNVSFSSSLNRLNVLRTHQKFVLIGNV